MNIFKKDAAPNYLLAGIMLVLIGAIIILASVPPVSRDALTHHLAVPKLYLKHGGIHEIPSIKFSYYPMNLDLLYLVPLYFGNDIIPKYIHFMFALLTAGLIFLYIKKRLDSSWGLLGSLFFLSLPIIVKLSITVYVDLGLIFFSTAAIISLFEWIERRFQLKYLIISGVCCGFALGTKYNGLLILFILALVIPFVFVSNTKKYIASKKQENNGNHLNLQLRAAWSCALFCLVALFVFSPWMVRNYIWKKNPIYPLYNSYFSHSGSQLNNDDSEDEEESILKEAQKRLNKNSSRWGPLAIRKIIYGESGWEIALIPVRIFFTGRDDDPKHFDGKLSPFLFLLPFCAFFQIRSNPTALRTEKKILVAFIVLYILYAFLQIDMRIRYVAPFIPPAVILSIFGLQQIISGLTRRRQKTPKWFAPVFMLLLVSGMLAYNGSYIIEQFNHIRPYSYLSGKLNRDQYIARYRPEYNVIHYINRHLPVSSKILALFLGNRLYYCDRELIFGNDLFKHIVEIGESPAEIREEMQKRGITHLFIRYDLFNFWAAKQFSDREKKILAALFDTQLFKITSHGGYGLFQLNSGGSFDDKLRTKRMTK